MRSQVTVRGWVYSAVAVIAPFVALALGDPSPALVALPAAAFVVFGLAARPETRPSAEVVIDPSRTVEEIPVEMRVRVTGEGRNAHVVLDLDPRLELGSSAGRLGRSGLVLPLVDGVGSATVSLMPRRWGSYPTGAAVIAVPGPMGIATASSKQPPTGHLVVLPKTETVRRLVEPLSKNLHAGDLVSAVRGPGFDVAEMRPWTPADSPRSINWRASARSDDLWATDRYADRNGDLILVIDSISGAEIGEAVTRAVRIAASLVRAYGAGRHRLGLLSLGGYHRWFGLDSGAVHEHRLLAAVMATQSIGAPVWAAVDRVLDRVVQPPAMVVFVSPLVDDALQGRVLRLARAGIDVMMLAVDVSAWLRPSVGGVSRLARRIWQLERERHLDHLRGAGVAVGEWRMGRPLEEVLEEIEEWRRRSRRARL